eukprot:jgi/Ulvmu1/8181/UM040_0078.1
MAVLSFKTNESMANHFQTAFYPCKQHFTHEGAHRRQCREKSRRTAQRLCRCSQSATRAWQPADAIGSGGQGTAAATPRIRARALEGQTRGPGSQRCQMPSLQMSRAHVRGGDDCGVARAVAGWGSARQGSNSMRVTVVACMPCARMENLMHMCMRVLLL